MSPTCRGTPARSRRLPATIQSTSCRRPDTQGNSHSDPPATTTDQSHLRSAQLHTLQPCLLRYTQDAVSSPPSDSRHGHSRRRQQRRPDPRLRCLSWRLGSSGGGLLLVDTSAISGDQLSAACRAVHPDAVPVSVHSAQLNSALSQSLLHGFPGWLGLHRSDSGDQFTWADGSPLDFQLWAAGEPSGDGELCVYMNADPQAGTWAACDCQQWNLPYMCQL